MRARLATAAALAASIALAAALWLGRSAREGAAVEGRAAEAAAEARLAAELAAGGEIDRAARAAVPVAEAAPVAEPAGGGTSANEPSAELVVRVVAEEDGAPLPGVPLFHQAWPGPLPQDPPQPATRTDEQGLAKFRLPAGGVQIYSLTQEDRKLVVELAPGEEREGILRLRSRADLDVHLIIVDARTGTPIAGAELELESHPEERTVARAETAIADAEGRVALRVPSWTMNYAGVSAAGYTSMLVDLGGAHSGREHAKRVELPGVARLEGSVTDGGGAPLAGVAVWAHAYEESLGLGSGSAARLSRYDWSAPTDLDGRYAFADLPAGFGLVFEVRDGDRLVLGEHAHLRLEPGELGRRDFRVGARGSIRGVVLDAAGAPLRRQGLWIVPGAESRELNYFETPVAKAVTDGEGRFLFQAIPSGSWLIGPEAVDAKPPGAPLSLGQGVELPEGVPSLEVELRIPASLFVTGRCMDSDGSPVADVEVWAVAVGAFATASAKSAADGTFALGPLPPGEVVLSVVHAAMTLDRRELTRVQAGESDVVLRLARSALVRGTVIDAATGTPISAEIAAFTGMLVRFATGTSSAFEIRDLPPGRCVLVARTSPGLVSAPVAVDLDPGEEAWVELVVAPGAQVDLRLPEDGKWECRLLVDGDWIGWLVPGVATTTFVPPGPFTVELWDLAGSGLLATRHATAIAGETLEIDLR